jgi:hypothetical protein
MENEADFIEKYYPNYSSCDYIARWNDIQKLIDEDYDYGDSAHKLMLKEFGEDYTRAYPMILREHLEIENHIYKQAILGYVKQGGC